VTGVELAVWVEKARRRLGRVTLSIRHRGPTRKSLAKTPTLKLDVSPDHDAAARYEAMVGARRYQLPEGALRVAILVERLTLEDERTFELLGLAIGLSRLGADVMILGPDAASPPGTDVLVCPADVSTTFDPAGEVDLPLMIAWVHGTPTRWVNQRGIDWFDVLLCGSSGLRDALIRLFAGPNEVFPHAVDVDVFRPSDDDRPRRTGLVSTVEQSVDHRPLVEAIGSTPFALPAVILDSPRTYPRSLRRFARGAAGPFARPSVFRRVTFAFSAPTVGEFRGEVLERTALEALSCGAGVVSRTDLGALGLASPTRVPDGQLGPVLNQPADPSAIERDREHIRRSHSHDARAARLMEIVAETSTHGGGFGVLGYYPNYVNHPYVQRLYRGLRPRGVRAIPVAGPQGLFESRGLRQRRSVFHLQWTQPILAGAANAGDALGRAQRFLDQLDRLRMGTPIVWTVHNVLPHECAHPDAEIRLCAGVAEMSDVIHLLTEATIDATAGLYRLPADRVRVIPYVEDPVTPTVSRAEARARLSLAEDDVVYLAFGRVRPYKHLGRLLDAFARHRRTHQRSRLIVAGHVERFTGSARLAARCRREAGVVARLGHIADGDVETLFAASDATIVSYPTLNSGVAVTSVAHGCPVAAPRTGALPEVIGRDGGLVFAPDEDLADVLDRLYALVTETDIRARVTARSQTRSSAAMATEFARVVDELMHRER
jgi:glycosyltransferase involved in cell wall biosynthesis